MAENSNHAAQQLVVCNEGEHLENFVATVEPNPVARDEDECLSGTTMQPRGYKLD